jgi:hypothetical protein
MNAYPLIAKLPGDVCQHINFFLVQDAKEIICKYYCSNPYLEYKALCLKYEKDRSSETSRPVMQFCERVCATTFLKSGNYGQWHFRAEAWYLKKLNHKLESYNIKYRNYD